MIKQLLNSASIWCKKNYNYVDLRGCYPNRPMTTLLDLLTCNSSTSQGWIHHYMEKIKWQTIKKGGAGEKKPTGIRKVFAWLKPLFWHKIWKIVFLAGFMKNVPSDSRSPHTLNWLNWSKYRQKTQLLPMVRLRWLSSWFLISKRNVQVHQKDTLHLFIHSSCLKSLNNEGRLRLNQVLSREFKAKSPPWLPPPPPPA